MSRTRLTLLSLGVGVGAALIAGVWWASRTADAGSEAVEPGREPVRFEQVPVRSSTPSTLSVKGVVRDTSGEPIAGARVSLAASSQTSVATLRCEICQRALLACGSPETAKTLTHLLDEGHGQLEAALTTTSDATGRFAFEHLVGTSFSVWAEARGLGASLKDRVAPLDPVELYLPPERAIVGTVRNEHGQPLRATVRAMARRLSKIVTTTSDADGRYRLDGLGEGPFVVIASAAGALPAATGNVAAGNNALDFNLALPRRLDVRLLDAEGRLVDGAVQLRGDHLAKEVAAPRGLATLGDLAPREVLLVGVAGELASSPVRVMLSKPVTSVSLQVVKGGRVSVSVVDEEGLAVSGASLELTTSTGDVVAKQRLAAGEIARFGPLAPGAFKLGAVAENYQPTVTPVTLTTGSTSVELTLLRGTTLAGRVVDEYGRPAPRVSVLIVQTGEAVFSDDEGRFSATVPSPGLYTLDAHHSDWGGGAIKVTAPKLDVELQLEPKAGAAVTVTAQGQRIEGAQVSLGRAENAFSSDRPSGSDGVVLMRGVPAGSYTLMATHPGYLPSNRAPISLQDGVLVQASAELRVGAAISGQVVDESGGPVSGVKVALAPRSAEPSLSDETGHFRLSPLEPKTSYTVRVASRGIEQTERVVVVAPADEVRVKVKRQNVYQGRVLGHDQPLTAFRINGFEVSSTDGRFEVALPARGDAVSLQVEASGFAPLKARRPNTPQLGDFELEPVPQVSGVVRDESGQPVREAIVGCDGCEQSVLSDEGGHFSMPMPALQHEFRVTATKARRGAAITVTDSKLTGIELVLKPALQIVGHAWLADGRPAAGVQVSVLMVNRSEVADAVTDGDGAYTLELMPDTYRFVLRVPSQASADLPVLITRITEAHTRLDLGATPGMPSVTVQVAPVPGYALWLVRGELGAVGNPPMELLQAEWAQLVYQPHVDRVTFMGVPPGRYSLVWANYHANDARGPVVVPIDVSAPVDVSLIR